MASPTQARSHASALLQCVVVKEGLTFTHFAEYFVCGTKHEVSFTSQGTLGSKLMLAALTS